jgi:endonuclease G
MDTKILLLAVASLTLMTEPALAGCHSDPSPVLVNQRLAQATTFLCNQHYSVLYSAITHGPLWAAERLTGRDVESGMSVTRTGVFLADPRLLSSDAPVLADYRHSGYDRGHMVPSHDEPDRTSQAETFYLSNIVAQTAALNRGIWTGIEMATRDLAREQGVIEVVTGPGFDQTIETIGPDQVFVPAYTWKAIYVPVLRKGGAYVCANVQKRPACYTETIAALVKQTGINPFPDMPAPARDETYNLPRPEHSPYTPNGDLDDEEKTVKSVVKGWVKGWAEKLER